MKERFSKKSCILKNISINLYLLIIIIDSIMKMSIDFANKTIKNSAN